MQHQIYLFRNAKFGHKSEKQSSDQLELVLDESDEKDSDQDIDSTDTDDKDFETITSKRSKKRASKSLPKTLPYVGKIHDLADDEKVCGCGCALTHIKDDITE